MPDDAESLRAENRRLHRIIEVLMDRAERATDIQGNEFSLFETAVMLDEQVRQRTADLEAALRENERINRALRESESRYRTVVDQSLVGIALIDGGRFVFTNPRFDEIFGYSAEEILAKGPYDLALPDDHALIDAQFQRRLSGETDRVHYQLRCRHKDGHPLVVEIHGSLMESGGRRVLVSIVQDITERTRAEHEVQVLQERLREQSLRDPLTGLYNRRHLDAALPQALAQARKAGQPVSLLMGDLDHFKRINDVHGHPAGDEVLRRVAALLRRHARSSDIAGRYGGEEFLLILPGLAKADAGQRARQLIEAIAALLLPIDGQTIRLTSSIGVAASPDDGDDAEALIAAADAALYAAKHGGRNRVEMA
ncbi:diguanylate cyclase [Leptothrix sp. BB-4]